MSEQIMELIVFIAPIAAGFVSSVVIPIISTCRSIKYIKRKTDEVSRNKEIERLERKIDFLSNEILEMRGKRKWKITLYFI